MKGILKIQKNNTNVLKEEILSHSNKSLKKIYCLAGKVKESGYDTIEECLIDLKAKKFLAFGIDKKNTTKKMLDNVLKYTKNVYIWDNNENIEFNSNIFVFEYDEEAFVYLLGGEITDSALETDLSVYTKISFDLIKDKKEYEEYIAELTKFVKDSFVKLTKEVIEELLENKKIFTTKQYMHVLPSIAELLATKEEAEESVKEDAPEIPKVDLSSGLGDSFEIDLGDAFELEVQDIPKEPKKAKKKTEIVEEVETEAFGLNEDVQDIEDEEEYEVSNEVIDMESLVLETGVVKLDKSKIKKKEAKEEEQKAPISKKINLSKVSNIIMELAKKPTKGKDISKIKVPNYIKDMIPDFFEIMEEAKLEKTENGEFKQTTINLEIIDVNTGVRLVDKDAKLSQKIGQTYIEFYSQKIGEVSYEEKDIARIIKLAKNSYHIEIIPNGIEEYNLWEKLCTNSFRGSDRHYGLM